MSVPLDQVRLRHLGLGLWQYPGATTALPADVTGPFQLPVRAGHRAHRQAKVGGESAHRGADKCPRSTTPHRISSASCARICSYGGEGLVTPTLIMTT
ncbi:hypothetical protein GCM10023194_57090 [Planotetraspora phitsanulokensis]|uniref:Uncharacterized protein n=1 Tax=Planotetraspora phitsanulokensis TaxID=575192 RepID=A0A8J3UGW1_9ACTN|nr:hypothetical protein [Planotetraspora phitsanulokensis]GII43066.1 hypothetical protein Pph01_80690 [Planotetraspora phitsanulokensis]